MCGDSSELSCRLSLAEDTFYGSESTDGVALSFRELEIDTLRFVSNEYSILEWPFRASISKPKKKMEKRIIPHRAIVDENGQGAEETTVFTRVALKR